MMQLKYLFPLIILITCVACSKNKTSSGSGPILEVPKTTRKTQLSIEDPNVILSNPDMGWVLYDISSYRQKKITDDSPYTDVKNIAISNIWSYIELSQDNYDFTRMDEVYDFWKSKGRSIQFRISTEAYNSSTDIGALWKGSSGIPLYIINAVPETEKFQRQTEIGNVWFIDARNSFYQQRLTAFLNALANHYSINTGRPVELIDLRGFGIWGEWHTGYPYPDVNSRREALKEIIDIWSTAFLSTKVALSYSYDPDGPKEYYSGPTSFYDAAFTNYYNDFLSYSAFDHAMTKENITWRRDGCGGAIHSNERKLNEEAFNAGKGPMFSEMIGDKTNSGLSIATNAYNDALSIHPNFVQYSGSLKTNHPDVYYHVMRNFGYRLVPSQIKLPDNLVAGNLFSITMNWQNKGVGRALVNFKLLVKFKDGDKTLAELDLGYTGSNAWIKGQSYSLTKNFTMPVIKNTDYSVCIALYDPSRGGKIIQMPLTNKGNDGYYCVR